MTQRRLFAWWGLPVIIVAAVVVTGAQPGAPLERREFVIRDFRTESGVVLPEARVVYATLGTLNAERRQRDPAAVALHGQLQRLQLAHPGRDPTGCSTRRAISWF